MPWENMWIVSAIFKAGSVMSVTREGFCAVMCIMISILSNRHKIGVLKPLP